MTSEAGWAGTCEGELSLRTRGLCLALAGRGYRSLTRLRHAECPSPADIMPPPLANSFLLYLEQDDSDSLIVSATNHPDLLDTALVRRFDSVVRYELPDLEIAGG